MVHLPYQVDLTPKLLLAYENQVIKLLVEFMKKTEESKIKEHILILNKVVKGYAFLHELIEISEKCGTPSKDEMGILRTKLGELIKNLKDFKEFPKHENHIKALSQSFDMMVFLFIFPFEDYVKENFNNFDFDGNKVLKMNIPAETAFISGFKNVLKAFKDFILNDIQTNFWRGKESLSNYLSNFGKYTISAEPPKAASSGDSASAFFAEIKSLGENIRSKLVSVPKEVKSVDEKKINNLFKKKEEKNVEKIGTMTTEIEKIFYEGYQYTKLVLSKDAISPQFGFYFRNCIGVDIQFEGKIKTLTLDALSKCNITFIDLITSIDCINCSKCQIINKGTIKSINVEKSLEINIKLSTQSYDCKVTHSLSSDISITYLKPGQDPKDPENYKTYYIPYMFVSSILNDKPQTIPCEGSTD